jgi:hypothetical protein
MIKAQKFTFSYDRTEDRLKMLINYDLPEARIDFFITRVMLMRLIPVIEKILISSMTLQESEKSSNHLPKERRLGSKIATDETTLKLLDENRVYLLEKIDFQYQAKNNTVTLIFSAAGEIKCTAYLTAENFSQVMNGMLSAVPHSSWGIASNILAI